MRRLEWNDFEKGEKTEKTKIRFLIVPKQKYSDQILSQKCLQ